MALGFQVVATKGTAAAIAAAGVPVKVVNKVKDGRPHIVDMIKAGEIQLVFTTVDETRTAIADSRVIRTAALANRVIPRGIRYLDLPVSGTSDQVRRGDGVVLSAGKTSVLAPLSTS